MYYQEKLHQAIYLNELKVKQDIYLFLLDFLTKGLYKQLSKAYYKRGTDCPSKKELDNFENVFTKAIADAYYNNPKNSGNTIPPFFVKDLKVTRYREEYIMLDILFSDKRLGVEVEHFFYMTFNKKTNNYKLRLENEVLEQLKSIIAQYADSINSYKEAREEILLLKEESDLSIYPKDIRYNFFAPTKYYESVRIYC